MAAVPGSDWLALCGSLPPGAPADWFVRLTQLAHEVDVPVAIDTHGQALTAVMAALPDTVPDVFSPNSAELHHATGLPVAEALLAGDIEPALTAARSLVAQGIPASLTPHGALLVTPEPPGTPVAPVDVVSAVGAGDSALAGYLLARTAGADTPRGAGPGGRLRHRVRPSAGRHGAAAGAGRRHRRHDHAAGLSLTSAAS